MKETLAVSVSVYHSHPRLNFPFPFQNSKFFSFSENGRGMSLFFSFVRFQSLTVLSPFHYSHPTVKFPLFHVLSAIWCSFAAGKPMSLREGSDIIPEKSCSAKCAPGCIFANLAYPICYAICIDKCRHPDPPSVYSDCISSCTIIIKSIVDEVMKEKIEAQNKEKTKEKVSSEQNMYAQLLPLALPAPPMPLLACLLIDLLVKDRRKFCYKYYWRS
ncbi:hypothetical protein VNO80_05480 [Phaseolus coccineus]|uniref:Uncharacterized protein n=1 Tax=Phaseolus coccineus TaxID=3886 RepID=A0AAN9RGR6_PHACN